MYSLKRLFLVEKQKRNIAQKLVVNMKNNKKSDSDKLDQEEKALLSSVENNEWRSVKNLKKEKSSARKIATKTPK